MSSSATISAADIGFLRTVPNGRATAPPEPQPAGDRSLPSPTMSLQEVEREHIVRVLGYVKGHKTRAADLLGVSPKTLYNKIKVYGIKQSFE
jgi:DNA-binding NtrC family response regulator